jgi:hypothetical protein
MRMSIITISLCIGLAAGCGAQSERLNLRFGETALESNSASIALPDGQEYKTWEQPLKFSKTYYVDQSHPSASDDTPGTKNEPFLTINRAAQILQPGERVIVMVGTYRERVNPARGGTGPQRMISYEAAPGAEVIIKGSRLFKQSWTQTEPGNEDQTARIWSASLEGVPFEGTNPFSVVNLPEAQIDKYMPWAVWQKDNPNISLKRGLIFQNGHRLKQVNEKDNLPQTAGTYWVEPDGMRVYIYPYNNSNPNEQTFEITAQDYIFAPEEFQLGYIRVKGFIIEHAGNGFPLPQEGALSARGGHHWIIEDNTIRHCNSLAMDVGGQYFDRHSCLAEDGVQIVRRNIITDCGIGGIEGFGVHKTLLEENTISHCGWHDVEGIFETGGIKLHRTVNTVVRGNVVHDIIDAPGIWMDYAIVNSRVTRNVIFNVSTSFHGGIFMEASQKTNLVDHNIVWGVHGDQGVGIYQHDCDELIIAHNLIGACTHEAVKMRANENRRVLGRYATALRNKILNNIFVGNGRTLSIYYSDNACDYNVFGQVPDSFSLDDWRQANTWDNNSSIIDMQAQFDPINLLLEWSVNQSVPDVPGLDVCRTDFYGHPRDKKTTSPGPFVTDTGKANFKLSLKIR